jgi:photosystem II stability/assembly factor-like uncharacterized protein
MKVASLSYMGESEIWVAGSDEARGVLVHSRDAGQHWDVYRFEALLPGQISFATARDGWLTGRFEEQPGSLLATHDGGQTWQQVRPLLPPPPDGVTGRE